MVVRQAVRDQCTTEPAGAPFYFYLPAVHISHVVVSSLRPVTDCHSFMYA